MDSSAARLPIVTRPHTQLSPVRGPTPNCVTVLQRKPSPTPPPSPLPSYALNWSTTTSTRPHFPMDDTETGGILGNYEKKSIPEPARPLSQGPEARYKKKKGGIFRSGALTGLELVEMVRGGTLWQRSPRGGAALGRGGVAGMLNNITCELEVPNDCPPAQKTPAEPTHRSPADTPDCPGPPDHSDAPDFFPDSPTGIKIQDISNFQNSKNRTYLMTVRHAFGPLADAIGDGEHRLPTGALLHGVQVPIHRQIPVEMPVVLLPQNPVLMAVILQVGHVLVGVVVPGVTMSSVRGSAHTRRPRVFSCSATHAEQEKTRGRRVNIACLMSGHFCIQHQSSSIIHLSVLRQTDQIIWSPPPSKPFEMVSSAEDRGEK